jgi:hypothetical protein
MDRSDGNENAKDSIRFNDDGDSNEIDESNPQYEKQDDSRISTLRGITIDFSDDDENAPDSIRFNDDRDSNEIEKSDLQDEKHDDPRISTKCGITTSFPISNPQINLECTISTRK